MVIRMTKTMRPMTKSPLITSLREAADDVAGRGRALGAVRQDQPRGGDVERQPQQVATSSTVGKAENSSGFSIHSATIRISTDSAIEKARPRSITKAGIGRKKIDRMADDADREADVPGAPALCRSGRR